MARGKVAVGLSGGVDSAVAAYLLKDQGYDVFGVFMVNVHPAQLPGSDCRWEADYAAAKDAARHLKIPLYTWNFAAEYRRQVLREFFAEYRRGRTPNPDVRCNQQIKFGTFLRRAVQVGADFVATGHYAGVQSMGASGHRRYRLLRGIDPAKDQSYFLYRSSQLTLAHSLFPLGGMTKVQVRAMAKKIRLPNATRPDSQGICFVGEVKLFDFLSHYIRSRRGKILDVRGRELGQHRGAWFYTVGQRDGLGLPNGPWYVVSTDVRRNVVRVTDDPRDRRLFSRRFELEDVHWVSGVAPIGPLRCTVEVRYHQAKPRRGTVAKARGKWVVMLDQSERAVTPGQHAVFYRGREVVGGGVIGVTLAG